MSRLIFRCFVAVLLVSGPHVALADACLDWFQARSVGAKILQTRLMVAALSCGERDRYNSFVLRYEAELVEHNTRIQDYYRGALSGNPASHLNSLATLIANQASMDYALARTHFCTTSSLVLDYYLSQNVSTLATRAIQVEAPEFYGLAACRPEFTNLNVEPAQHRIALRGYERNEFGERLAEIVRSTEMVDYEIETTRTPEAYGP